MDSSASPYNDLAPSSAPPVSRKRPLGRVPGADHHGASENRRRDPKTSRACDSCKIKKIRCSGTLPCETCSRRRLSCAYASQYSRGRPPTPPPVPTAEPSLELTRRSSQIRAESYATSRSGRYTQSRLSLSHPSTPPESTGEGGGGGGGALTTTRAASPALVIEGQYFDLTSGLSFLHRARAKLSAQNGRTASYGSNDAERNQLLTSAGDRPFYLNSRESEVIPDDETARRLLLFYFDTCVVTYRMFHRQTVESWLDTLLQDRSQNRPISYSLGNAKCAIILTILAISSLRIARLQRGSPNDGMAFEMDESDRLFCAAMDLTNCEIGFPRLESAQARLIQVLYLLQTSRMNKAWYTFGNAYQVISSLGLHRRQARKQGHGHGFRGHSDYIVLQCSQRVFWTAYTIDQYLSVVFGRPRFIHDDEIDQDFPDSVNDEDMGPHGPLGPEEAAEECHVNSLIFHAKIAQIIGRISREVYRGGNRDQVAAAHRLIDELHEWRASLPPHLGMVKPSTLVASFRRESTALNLAYSHAVIHATRPFLLGDGSSLSKEPEVQNRIEECMSAAGKALELINSMANDNNLFYSFWWTQYVLFCALAVVYVWKMQQNANDGGDGGSGPYATLFDLAEKCRPFLTQDASATPSSHRYGIILDELRLEAQQQSLRNANVLSPQTQAPGIERDHPSAPARVLNDPQVPEAENLFLASSDTNLQAFPSTLWLDLDSSAAYPFYDIFDTSY